MKRCIFHYLHPVEENPGIGSALRPNRMLQAFRDIGYEVDTVIGYSSQRKKQIRRIRENIKNGVCYDFVYSESVNDPTALSDQDHIPRHPFMDFRFLKFCRKHGIPVGLFYRDMHWRFSVYRDHVSRWKQMIAIPLFRRDLRMYRKCVDILYVPSAAMGRLVPHNDTRPLPPGGQLRHTPVAEKQDDTLNIFYVGNVLGVYDITDFCRAVSQVEGVELTICTPRQSWEAAKHRYEPLCSRIQIVHKSAEELAPYYREADLFCCCLEANEYTRLAMPIKTFEAIGYGVPVLITKGIAAADLIAEANCGWVVENSAKAFQSLLTCLKNDPEQIEKTKENVLAISPYHTWASRAVQVSEELTERKEDKV